MKEYLRIGLLLGMLISLSNNLSAQAGTNHSQSKNKELQAHVAYWGNFGIQPGIKIGVQHNILEWQKPNPGKDLNKTRTLFVSPNLGVYTRRLNNTNLLAEVEVGLQMGKTNRKFFSTYSLGFGYLGRSQIMSVNYNLGDGSIQSKEREWRGNFLPTINYSLGKEISSWGAWFAKISYGPMLGRGRASSALIFTELGLKINLSR